MEFSISLSLLLLASNLVASAKDWPNWRGPNHDGISEETGLNLDGPKDGPKLLWQIEGCGRGYSSVVVADGKIITLGNKDGGEHLTAFREKDGSELWSTKFGTAGHSNGTPTVDGDLVYAIGKDGDLVCCKVADGEKVWSKRFDKDFGGKMMSGWGFSESPLIDGDNLICTPGAKDAMIVALNKKTGKKVWQAEVPDEHEQEAHMEDERPEPQPEAGRIDESSVLAQLRGRVAEQ